MRRWFLSFNSSDRALAERLKVSIERRDSGSRVFFDATSLRAGGYWQPALAQGIDEADAFVLLVGEKGLGPWQTLEYYEAHDKRVKSPEFPVVLMLLAGHPAPGLPFLRQLHWIVTADPTSEKDVARLIDAAAGTAAQGGELWRYTSPYRGLFAMEEKDADYFFGRGRETVEVINALAGAPDKLPVLLGNSGVGKSSLAQAGVLAALARQAWPAAAVDTGPWPQRFQTSRQWCFLTMRPGAEPIRSLIEPFLRTWQFDPTDPRLEERQTEWIESLIAGRNTLKGLLDATEGRLQELNQPKPPAFLIYIDQGEELYVRSEKRQRLRFSEVIAQGVADPRLFMLMSMRTDFLSALQGDEPLFDARRQIDVPPLREAQLREVVSRPAALLSARFETDRLAVDIAQRTAEESAKDAGALPLLSYLLDDMWTQMIKRGDGMLRLPPAAMEIGGVLVERANSFLALNPRSEDALRRVLTLKLATVREDGEPTRRRAFRSEFTDDEWRLVSELAGHPNRLLVTATPENGESYAEVAHEAIFRRWEKLREWIVGQKDFLIWKSALEADRRAWEAASANVKSDTLLLGFKLTQAQGRLAERAEDLATVDRQFIAASVAAGRAAARNRQRLQGTIGVLMLGTIALLLGVIFKDEIGDRWFEYTELRPYIAENFTPYVLKPEDERALKPGDTFRECASDCPEMVVIPAGEFWMGSRDGEGHVSGSEYPRHKVKIDKRFAVGKFEVTWNDWDACVAKRRCDGGPTSDNDYGMGRRPLINVSWDQAKVYVNWLSQMTGKQYQYRLLSEAEWEYAARGVTSGDAPHPSYPWGDKASHENANYGTDECCQGKTEGKDTWYYTAPVGQFPANAFGLYDMHGNVYEWVEDPWHGNYSGSPPTNGSAWTEGGDEKLRGTRGGSWWHGPDYLRSAIRYRLPTHDRNNYLGFRVARTLTP
jgi:formylglycine-generating enzyme required for sulfatase activity